MEMCYQSLCMKNKLGVVMEFLKGMDISFLPEMLDSGAIFFDKAGNERNVFELLKENGVNSIRLRLWNEPENVPQSKGYCSLLHTINMAKKIKEYGMSFFLDFHYSDWWADPGKQDKPEAWKALSFEELKKAVYEYTKEVLLCLEKEEVYPDLVQIGNEIRSGMLFPDGEVPKYSELVQIINAGIQGVKDTKGIRETKIVIHLDQGGRYFYLKDWFDQAFAAGLEDFDIIGVSYYPFWHGTFREFKETLEKMVDRYHKPIVVAETAHAWRLTEEGFVGKAQEKIAGFPATPIAQQKVIDLVMNITASLKEEMGIGIYYWEPVVLPMPGMGGWSSNMGIFNEEGRALPALESFRFDKTQRMNGVAKVYSPERQLAVRKGLVKLPPCIKVLYYDGSLKEHVVEWENFETDIIGVIVIHGRIPDIDENTTIEVELVEELKTDYNYIDNGDFSRGLEGWDIIRTDERVQVEVHPEFIDPFPSPPIHYIYVESPINARIDIKKKIKGLQTGIYNLSMDYKGTNTTGVDVRLMCTSKGHDRKEEIIYPTDEKWITYTLMGITVNKGEITLGLSISSPPVFAMIRKFTLTRQNKDALGGTES